MTFIREIFQDVDGGFSMKRSIAFLLMLGIFGIIGYVSFYGAHIPVITALTAKAGTPAASVAIPQSTLNFLHDALAGLLGTLNTVIVAILGEHLPQLAASFKGEDTAKSSATP